MSANMYRVGDYVYFEISSSAPYQIRRIEELNKTASGNVEAKVMCFYRRRDISPPLLAVADRHQGKESSKCKPSEASTSGDESSEAKEAKAEAPTDDPMENGLSAPSPPAANGAPETNGTSAAADAPAEKMEEGEEPAAEASEEAKPKAEPSEPSQPSDAAKEEPAEVEEEAKEEAPTKEPLGPTVGLPGMEELGTEERHRLRHRELFLSRQIETLPATHIRGKCTVTLLNQLETPDSYLGGEASDAFFYSLVYDPAQKTLLADKGEIRVGDKHQCHVPPILSDEERDKDREGQVLDTLVFRPDHSLSDRDIDQFLIVARAVGTFSRALDTSSSVKLPSLHMTAAAASRDVTLFHAMALLHHAKYELGQAVKYLVPPPSKQHYPLEADKTTGHHTVSLGGPILCRDQIEEWSAAEANLFEEALEKYGKDFNDIRNDFLPWKALKDIVEYYYMWKTTDRYVQQKRVKAMEAEHRLKQVYIPNYNRPNQNLIGAPASATAAPTANPYDGKSCESCSSAAATAWYHWGPPQFRYQLCGDCWAYWKKFGGLKRLHQFESYDKNAAAQGSAVGPTASVASGVGSTGGRSLLPAGMGGQRGQGSQGGGRVHAPPTQFSAAGLGKASGPVPGGPSGIGPKTRAAFFLQTTMLTRIARRLSPKNLLNPRKNARNPFLPVNMLAIKQFCQQRPVTDLQTVAKMIHSRSPAASSPAKAVNNNGTGGGQKRPAVNGTAGPDAKRPANGL